MAEPDGAEQRRINDLLGIIKQGRKIERIIALIEADLNDRRDLHLDKIEADDPETMKEIRDTWWCLIACALNDEFNDESPVTLMLRARAMHEKGIANDTK